MKNENENKNDNDKILIGITVTKSDNFSEWYRQMIVKAEMIDYGEISGCYILRPNAYSLWEKIQDYVDFRIKKMGVKNAYFPLFGTKNNLEKEQSHLEGFTAEVAWVTKAGSSDLAEPIFVRPTSETLMYGHFANWIKSHRDLPLKINQWCNVVRWEFKDCTPFIRSREFLWQEAHTCFKTREEADKEVQIVLEMYANVYRKLLAVPVIMGKKSVREKFAGADYTTTVECFVPAIGKAIQGATSHCLGQNFSKMFDIKIEINDYTKQYVYQNSWGITTRTIGVMAMVHGDDQGLVLPPAIAPIQVIIIPCGIGNKTTHSDAENIENTCKEMVDILALANIVAQIDDRDQYRVGYKFNYWELRGVPLRIEIGPNDIKKSTVIVCRRDTKEKQTISYANGFPQQIQSILDTIQQSMYNKAEKELNQSICTCHNNEELMCAIKNKCMGLAPWCEIESCEDSIVAICKNNGLSVKSLCIPFDNIITENSKCFSCGLSAKSFTLFGSSY